MPLLRRREGSRERVLIFTRELDKLYDPHAYKIDNELISDKLGYAFDPPPPTPSFECLDKGRQASHKTSDTVIVAEPDQPDRDTKLVVHRSDGHWSSYAEGIRREQANPQQRAYRLIWGWLGICAVVFVMLLWLAAPAYRTQYYQEPDNAANTHRATTPAGDHSTAGDASTTDAGGAR